MSGSAPSAVPVVDPMVAMNAQVAHMNAQGQIMHDEIAALRVRLHDTEAERVRLMNAQQSSVVRAVSAPTVHRPKIPLPAVFAGTIGSGVEAFIQGMQRQFSYQPELFRDEASKVEYASNYLIGSAIQWYTTRKDELAGSANGPTSFASWAQLVNEMRARFQPISSAVHARQSLDAYQQLGSIQNYIDHFYSCMTFIGDMSVSDQLHNFIKGLKKDIKREVIRADPQTIGEAVACASKAELYNALGSQQSQSTGRNGGNNRYPSKPYSSASSNSFNGSTAMDVNLTEQDDEDVDDAASTPPTSRRELAMLAKIAELSTQAKVQSSLLALFGQNKSSSKPSFAGKSSGDARVPNISKADYARCRAEGRCLKCRKAGHVARDCTNPQSTNW